MLTDELAHRVTATQECIRALLASERRQILEEIRNYPTPIPRCDQQFNHLIDRRELLVQELARLDAATGSSLAPSDRGARLDAFIDSCACLDAELKLRLQTSLRDGVLGGAKIVHDPGA
jgi:hypothetical protein